MKKLSEKDVNFLNPSGDLGTALLSSDFGAIISTDGYRLHALKCDDAPANCTVEITTYGDLILDGPSDHFPSVEKSLEPHQVLEGIAIPCNQLADAIDPNRRAAVVLRIVLTKTKDGKYSKALEIISEDRYALIMGMAKSDADDYPDFVEMWKPVKRSPMTVQELNSLADTDKE